MDNIKNKFCLDRKFKNGFAIVRKNNEYNIINKNNKLISDVWYDYIREGNIRNDDLNYFIVRQNKKVNYISQQGKIMLSNWVDKLMYLNNGFACVELNNKWNVINILTDKYLSGDWYDYVYMFTDNCSLVKLNNKFNYIDIDGNLLFKKWFDEFVCHSFYNGYALIYCEKTKLWNFIDKKGNYLFKNWYLNLGNYNEKYIPVKIKDKGWNYINKNEKILFDNYYDKTTMFENNIATVKKNNKYNIINYNGELLSNIWVDYISPNYDYNNILHVIKNNKENIMNKQGKILSSVWFDSINYFREKIATVKKNGKYNIMNINGNLLFNIWFDEIIDFYISCDWVDKQNCFVDTNVFIIVKKRNKYNIINKATKSYMFNVWADHISSAVYYTRKNYIILNSNKYLWDIQGNVFHSL